MDVPGKERFAQLPPEEQTRYRIVGQQMVQFAETHAVPIIFGSPAWRCGKISGATGCIIQLGSRFFVITASHVLEGYEAWIQDEVGSVWQVGHLGFEPHSRIVWRDKQLDVVMLELSAKEASSVGTGIVSAPHGWPPPLPSTGQLVLISGYPKLLRQTDSPGRIGSGAISSLLVVRTVGDGYFYCQLQHEDIISFSREPVPPADTDYGGWSGGPVFLVGQLSYPLVGIVSQFQGGYGLLRAASFTAIRLPD